MFEVEPELTLEQQVDIFQANLLDDGVDGDVADCVTRLAEHDLRSGGIDPVALDELILNCERAEDILNDQGTDDQAGQTLAFADDRSRSATTRSSTGCGRSAPTAAGRLVTSCLPTHRSAATTSSSV